MPEGAIYIGRPSRWGNTFPIGGMAHIDSCPSDRNPICFTLDRERAVALFRIYA